MNLQGQTLATKSDAKPAIPLGDDAMVTAWMEQYGQSILRTAFLLLRDRHLAEDIAQETFVRAYRKHNQLQNIDAPLGWLNQIAINLCRQRMRTAAWKRLVFRDHMDETIVSPGVGPEDATVRSSLTSYVHQLPYKYREVIVLFYYQSLSIVEICDLLRVNPGTVKSRLSRARSILKNAFSEEDLEHD